MATHSHDQPRDEASVEPLADLLRRKGAKQIRAWILPPEPSPESRRKAAQRARQEKGGETQINLVMTNNEDARALVRAVAEAVRDPQIRSTIAAVANGDPWLQRIVDVTKLAEDNLENDAAHGQTDHESREHLRSVIETVIDNELVFGLIRQIMATPTLAALLVEISRRDDLKELVTAAVKRPALAETLWALSKAEDNTLLNVAYVIRSPKIVETVRNVASNPLVGSAVAGAIRAPKAVSSAVSVLEAGGIRARILSWILGL